MAALVAPSTMGEDDRSKFPSVVLPDSNFLYQNNVTGDISKVPLSVLQLCRILCRPCKSPPLRHLNSATNVLLLEPDSSYSKAGWWPARDVPVLKESVALWYYYHQASTIDNDKSDPKVASTEAVSCRELAVVYSKSCEDRQFQVSGALTNSEWKPLAQLPDLMLAVQVFADEKKQLQSHAQSSIVDDSNPGSNSQETQYELELFLKSTEQQNGRLKQEENYETYESDGGTQYIKDPRTGNWVHHDLYVPPPTSQTKKRSEDSAAEINIAVNRNNSFTAMKSKNKKAKFSSKKARCWVYASGLPRDCTTEEVASVFGKAGLLDLDEETQRPKIKLYRNKATGQLKGDASICYARPESVPLAITLLDDAPFRMTAATNKLKVEEAKFEQHGEKFDDSRRREHTVSAKRKVAKLATRQALDWDDVGLEANGRLTGGRKGLRIVVLKHVFDPKQLQQNKKESEDDSDDDGDRLLRDLEREIGTKCAQWGVVEKITVFSQNPEGVVVVKFAQPSAASEAVRELDGCEWNPGKLAIEAIFWDGVTDFTAKAKEEEEEAKRHEKFGNWLETQDLPEELQLATE